MLDQSGHKKCTDRYAPHESLRLANLELSDRPTICRTGKCRFDRDLMSMLITLLFYLRLSLLCTINAPSQTGLLPLWLWKSVI